MYEFEKNKLKAYIGTEHYKLFKVTSAFWQAEQSLRY